MSQLIGHQPPVADTEERSVSINGAGLTETTRGPWTLAVGGSRLGGLIDLDLQHIHEGGGYEKRDGGCDDDPCLSYPQQWHGSDKISFR